MIKVAQNIKSDTDKPRPFILEGKPVHSIEDLINEIKNMDSLIFETYVNAKKNDFATWVEEVFQNKNLGLKLRFTKDKEIMTIILENFIAENNKQKKESGENKWGKTALSSKIEEKMQKIESNESVEKKESPEAPLKMSIFKRMRDRLKNIAKKEKAQIDEVNDNLAAQKQISEIEDEYKPEFIKTGVLGFDELITNGIPKGSSVLLCGGAGTGKTTFSLQIINHHAKSGKKCIYLTFEEDVSRLKSHMRDYGWNPTKLEKEGNLIIKKMDPFEISRSVEALLAKASGELIIDIDEVEGVIPSGFKSEIIVLDSLSAVSAAFVGKEEGYRIYVEQLFNMFKKIGATSFLISEVEENTNKYTRTGIEEFLADAVVVFYSLRQKSVRVNAVEIIKVRGTSHQKKIVPFKMITGQGMIVFPKEDPFIE